MLSVGLLFNQFVTQTRGVFKLENCLECLRQREPACNALVFQNIFFPFPALGTCHCSFTQSYLWRTRHVNHTYWCPRMSRIYLETLYIFYPHQCGILFSVYFFHLPCFNNFWPHLSSRIMLLSVAQSWSDQQPHLETSSQMSTFYYQQGLLYMGKGPRWQALWACLPVTGVIPSVPSWPLELLAVSWMQAVS